MTAFAIMRADFFQRLRTPSFNLVLLAAAFVALLAFPSPEAGYATLDVYGYRGLYTSAWIGDALAIQISALLPLVGFYLVKNAIALDRRTGVQTLLAASGTGRLSYIFGKWLGNIGLLAVIVLVMNGFAIVKQLYLGESYSVNLIDQFRTQIGLVAAIAAVIAGWAVLFETLPVLRGGIGNMLYVFVWAPFLVIQMQGGFGAAILIQEMQDFAEKQGKLNEHVQIGGSPRDHPLATFDWPGATLDGGFWLSAAEIAAFGVGLALLAALLYRLVPRDFALPDLLKRKQSAAPLAPAQKRQLTALPAFSHRLAGLQLFRGELRLMFRSQSRYWYLGLGLLWLLSQTVPAEGVASALMPASALWATLALSSLGCRDRMHDVTPLVASTPHRESGRLLAAWAAGVCLQAAVFAGLALRFWAMGETVQIVTLLVAALFIPALALALGRFTGTSRSFEFLYVFLWYIGPLDHGQPFDFLGTTLAETGQPAYGSFLAAAVALLAAALVLGFRDPMARRLIRA